jgi:Ethanolamine utilization protein EutJ (predicted chaperonin)
MKKVSKTQIRRPLGVFSAIIEKYAQAIPAETADGAALDPQSIQMGQSVYDSTGKEYLVVEDDPTTTYKTLMPKDQQGVDTPEGITTVDDSELSVDYSVQQPAGGAVIASEFLRN